MDQLIELYAVLAEREKGALGLLLEMNNFLGLSLIGYLTVFVNMDSSNVPDEYSSLKAWLNFQVIWLYVCLGLCLLMVLCFRSM